MTRDEFELQRSSKTRARCRRMLAMLMDAAERCRDGMDEECWLQRNSSYVTAQLQHIEVQLKMMQQLMDQELALHRDNYPE